MNVRVIKSGRDKFSPKSISFAAVIFPAQFPGRSDGDDFLARQPLPALRQSSIARQP